MTNKQNKVVPQSQTLGPSVAGLTIQAFHGEHQALMQTVIRSQGHEGTDVLLRHVAAKPSKQHRLWLLHGYASTVYPPYLSHPAAKALVREAFPLRDSSSAVNYVKEAAKILFDDAEGRDLLANFMWQHGPNLPSRSQRCEALVVSACAYPFASVHQEAVLERLVQELDLARHSNQVAFVRQTLPSYIANDPKLPDFVIRPLYITWLHKTAQCTADAGLAASCLAEAQSLTLPGEAFADTLWREEDERFLKGRPDLQQWQKRLDNVSSQPERYAGLLDMMLGATAQMDQEARAVYCAMLVDQAQAASPPVDAVVKRGLSELVTQAAGEPTQPAKIKALHAVFRRIRTDNGVLHQTMDVFRDVLEKTETQAERFELYSSVLMLDGKAPSVQTAVAQEWANEIEKRYSPKGAAEQALLAMDHIYEAQYYAKSELAAVVLRAEPKIDDAKTRVALLSALTKRFPMDLGGCPPKVDKQMSYACRRLQHLGQVACKPVRSGMSSRSKVPANTRT